MAIHKKFILPGFLLCISVMAVAQTDYHSLMDSLKSDTYIGMEIELQEVEVEDKSHKHQGDLVSFYKTNKLNSTDDVLSRLPGISMIKRGNYAWEPSMHGLSGGQINVNIDGMKIFGACTDKMDPVTSYIEPNNMESVVISEGMKGSEHGCTVGGSVVFETVKPKFRSGTEGSISSRYESAAKSFSQLASLNISKDKLAVRLNGAFRKYHDYRSGGGTIIPYSAFQKSNYAVSASYMLSSNSLLSFDFLGDDAKNVGYPALPMDVAFARAKIFGAGYHIWNPLKGIEHFEAKVYSNYINHAMDDSQRDNVVIRMDMPGNTKTNGAYINTHFSHKQHRLQAKLDYFNSTAYAEMTMFINGEIPMFMQTWPDVKRSDFAVFLLDKIVVGKNTFEGKLRVEYADTKIQSDFGRRQFSVFGFENKDMKHVGMFYNTGVSIQRNWNDHFNSSLTFDQGNRLATVSEQFGFYLFNSYDGYDYVGNPSLKPEESSQLNIESTYTNKDLELRVNLFHYWFDNYIFGTTDNTLDAMTIGSNGVRVYKNIPGVTFKGFDFSLFLTPSPNTQLLLSTKYTLASDGNAEPLPLIPPLKNNLAFIYNHWKIKIQAELEWSTKQNRINDNFGEVATNGYLISNIRFDKKINIKESTLGLSAGVENLFDKNYREHLDWGNIPQPGRNYYFSVSYSF